MTTRWAQGWYRSKRHVIDEAAVVDGRNQVRAICSQYTGVYQYGRERRDNPAWTVPPADSDEVMAAAACKLCLRKSGTPA